MSWSAARSEVLRIEKGDGLKAEGPREEVLRLVREPVRKKAPSGPDPSRGGAIFKEENTGNGFPATEGSQTLSAAEIPPADGVTSPAGNVCVLPDAAWIKSFLEDLGICVPIWESFSPSDYPFGSDVSNFARSLGTEHTAMGLPDDSRIDAACSILASDFSTNFFSSFSGVCSEGFSAPVPFGGLGGFLPVGVPSDALVGYLSVFIDLYAERAASSFDVEIDGDALKSELDLENRQGTVSEWLVGLLSDRLLVGPMLSIFYRLKTSKEDQETELLFGQGLGQILHYPSESIACFNYQFALSSSTNPYTLLVSEGLIGKSIAALFPGPVEAKPFLAVSSETIRDSIPTCATPFNGSAFASLNSMSDDSLNALVQLLGLLVLDLDEIGGCVDDVSHAGPGMQEEAGLGSRLGIEIKLASTAWLNDYLTRLYDLFVSPSEARAYSSTLKVVVELLTKFVNGDSKLILRDFLPEDTRALLFQKLLKIVSKLYSLIAEIEPLAEESGLEHLGNAITDLYLVIGGSKFLQVMSLVLTPSDSKKISKFVASADKDLIGNLVTMLFPKKTDLLLTTLKALHSIAEALLVGTVDCAEMVAGSEVFASMIASTWPDGSSIPEGITDGSTGEIRGLFLNEYASLLLYGCAYVSSLLASVAGYDPTATLFGFDCRGLTYLAYTIAPRNATILGIVGALYYPPVTGDPNAVFAGWDLTLYPESPPVVSVDATYLEYYFDNYEASALTVSLDRSSGQLLSSETHYIYANVVWLLEASPTIQFASTVALAENIMSKVILTECPYLVALAALCGLGTGSYRLHGGNGDLRTLSYVLNGITPADLIAFLWRQTLIDNFIGRYASEFGSGSMEGLYEILEWMSRKSDRDTLDEVLGSVGMTEDERFFVRSDADSIFSRLFGNRDPIEGLGSRWFSLGASARLGLPGQEVWFNFLRIMKKADSFLSNNRAWYGNQSIKTHGDSPWVEIPLEVEGLDIDEPGLVDEDRLETGYFVRSRIEDSVRNLASSIPDSRGAIIDESGEWESEVRNEASRTGGVEDGATAHEREEVILP